MRRILGLSLVFCLTLCLTSASVRRGDAKDKAVELALAGKSRGEAPAKSLERLQGTWGALAIHEKAYGGEHPQVSVCCGNLSASLAGQGRYAEAEVLTRRALAIDRKTLGEDHPNTAAGSVQLAESLSGQGHSSASGGTHSRTVGWNTPSPAFVHHPSIRATRW